jgi:Tfp pilus assembly protein PilW
MKKIKLKSGKKLKGFSLMELLVAMFISTLIVTTVVAAFASTFRTQKIARDTQRDIEDAKTTLEYMAKIIRMSSSMKPDATTAQNTPVIYIFNKTMNECIGYWYDNSAGVKKIKEQSCTPLDESNPCTKGILGASGVNFNGDCSPVETVISSTLSDAEFYIPAYGTAPSPIKRLTIRMQTEHDSGAKMQTTISLRDYKKVNPVGQ